MKTKTIKLYSLDELSKEAQEKAHSDWSNGNDYMFLEDHMAEWLHELLEENGIKDTNDTSKPGTKPTPVLYSLSNSQGDGVMFCGTFQWKKYQVHIMRVGKYYHSNSKTIEIQALNNLGFDIVDDGAISDEESEKIYQEFDSVYQTICKELERKGYEAIEYENSMELFREVSHFNDWTFREDGVMENL